MAAASTIMRKQVRSLYSRASRELVDWMHTPLTPIPALAAWLEAKSAANPTLQEFLDLCFKAALTLDLNARTLTFSKEDASALGFSENQTITIFTLFTALPRLFL